MLEDNSQNTRVPVQLSSDLVIQTKCIPVHAWQPISHCVRFDGWVRPYDVWCALDNPPNSHAHTVVTRVEF